MTDDIKIWLPPMLTLLGTLIVVTFTAWLSTRSVHSMIGELRQEVRADIGTLRGELKLDGLRLGLQYGTSMGNGITKHDLLEALSALENRMMERVEGRLDTVEQRLND